MTQALPHLCNICFYLPLFLLIPCKQRGEQSGVRFLFLFSIRLLYLPLGRGEHTPFYHISSHLDKTRQATSARELATQSDKRREQVSVLLMLK